MTNIQVTHSGSPENARSESAIAINPNNPQQIVASSKRFRDLYTYDFTLATSYSEDGGLTWHDSADLALPTGATLMTDPTQAWDDVGNVFLVGLLCKNPPTADSIGMAVYKSTDGGKTWGTPKLIHQSIKDDKQWAAGDTNPASPHHGNVYAVWDDNIDRNYLRFARTKDHGATWTGVGGSSIDDSFLADDSFSPEINVAANGDVYIVWRSGSAIKMLVSTDGGDSFHAATAPATGTTPYGSVLGYVHRWHLLPGGNFRVVSVPTACVLGKTVAVAWDDFREGPSRIYYALSIDSGASWITGPSGRPLLITPIDQNLHHFFPQIIFDPNGVIGCTFYEFGPKPATPLIDVIMAQSYDGGSSFISFTVTDQPWNPAVGAPWAHHGDDYSAIDASVTFIGDYFGIDASARGFYPLWTDTRTGTQELWAAIVPERRCNFLVERSTLGQDEVDARRKLLPSGLPIKDAFKVVVDGFTAAQLGLTDPGSKLNVPSPIGGMTIACTGNTADNNGYGPEIQRFTFHYDIDFDANDSAFGFATATETVTLQATVHGISASAQIDLIKQPDPFILHGDPAWLSVDLRVFVVRAGNSKFGVAPLVDAADAPRFIQDIMKALTEGQGTAGGQSFDDPNVLSPDEESSALYLQPTDENGDRVFNFALAKVHYIGTIGATDVRVFFRLFQAESTNAAYDYPPGSQYRRAPSESDGQPIPLAGFQGSEYVTMPFFASSRIKSTLQKMTTQTDKPNVQRIIAQANGSEVDVYFGCWLDINQPFKPGTLAANDVLPLQVPAGQPDGPFNDPANPPVTVQEAIVRNLHQCLIAEVAFDPVPIPFGKDPSNWDKLAQRNIAWSPIGSAQALSTFEVRPTPAGKPAGDLADELLIDWRHLPAGSRAQIYLPAVSAADVLAMASRMYTSHKLTRVDDHTLEMRATGITYMPVPPGAPGNYAGLLSVDVPDTSPKQRTYRVVVHQVTNADGRWTPKGKEGAPAQPGAHRIKWRRLLGAFQLEVPVKTKTVLLPLEQRNLSVLRWIKEAIPENNRWRPVFDRYLDRLASRVSTFGGDPKEILPSPIGEGRRERIIERELRRAFTGKVTGLLFDHFGDFEGFLLDTGEREQEFASREREVAELVERAWHELLRITVWAALDDPHRLLSITVLTPPASFH